jgi:hypothetical protein
MTYKRSNQLSFFHRLNDMTHRAFQLPLSSRSPPPSNHPALASLSDCRRTAAGAVVTTYNTGSASASPHMVGDDKLELEN